MKKILILTSALVSLLSFGLFVNNVEAIVLGEKKTEMVGEMQQKREEVKMEIQEKREGLKEEMQQKREEFKTMTEEKREEKKGEIEVRIEEMKTKRVAKRSEIGAKHAERVQKRFTAYSERLNTMIGKFQTRLEAMEEGDAKTAAQAKLNEAYGVLETASSQASEAVVALGLIDPESENYKADVESGKGLTFQARNSYKQVLVLLKEALALMK